MARQTAGKRAQSDANKPAASRSRGTLASQVAKKSPSFKRAATNLGLRIRELRQSRGWTLDEAAEHSNLELKHLQKVEAGLINTTLVTLVRLADGFEVPLSELFRPVESPGSHSSKRRRDASA